MEEKKVRNSLDKRSRSKSFDKNIHFILQFKKDFFGIFVKFLF